MGRLDELTKLQSLKDSGAITEEEFVREKERIMSMPDVAAPPPSRPMFDTADATRPWGMDLRTYCVLLHISQFAGFLLPGAGFAVPIVMWIVNKDRFPDVDRHGRVILNWMISALIYAAVCFVLTFILIGILGFVALAIMGIIFPIMGALKANDGIVWKYPLSIEFLK